MAIELNAHAKQPVEAAVSRGAFPDQETAIGAPIVEAFEDTELLRAEIEAACAELDAGQGISVEDWLEERKRYRAAQGRK